MEIAGYTIDDKDIKDMAQGAIAYGNLDPWDYKNHCANDAAHQAQEYIKRFGFENMETDDAYELACGIYKAVMKEIGF